MTIFLNVSPFSPSLVTMSSSEPIDVGRMTNWYHEPMSEDDDRKDEGQCDSEVKGEGDEWLGTENQWCPLLDLSYHYFFGPRLLGIIEKMDAASIPGTCGGT